MAKPSTLKKKKRGKNTYWFARIRGTDHLFGNAKTTSRIEAQQRFAAALGATDVTPVRSPAPAAAGSNVAKLYDDYMEWAEKRHSADNIRTTRNRLDLFCGWLPDGSRRAIHKMPVMDVTVDHLLSYMDFRRENDSGPGGVWHDVTDVKKLWNWGAGRNRYRPIASHMPLTHDPFRPVTKPTPDQKNMSAAALPTDQEIDQLLRRLKGAGAQPILDALHQTGARPSEMCKAKVRDFQPTNSTMVLYEHKNDGRRTGTTAKPRIIPLSSSLQSLIAQHCKGKALDEPIFTGPRGGVWTTNRLGLKFRQAREALGVREHITLYSFRDLWISEALRGGFAIANVADAAGTSVEMIEKTYGHFYTEDMVAMADAMAESRERRKKATRK